MAAIFDGVDELIDRALRVTDIGKAPHYQHKASGLRLISKPYGLNCHELWATMLTRIEKNWICSQESGLNRPGSRQNWRFEKQEYISSANSSIEKLIEKAIAVDCDETWVNQVPTASGLIDSTSERHCNLDLVHRVGEDAFEFIELKNNSDTPVYAAFELLKYAAIYCFSRKNASVLGYDIDQKFLLTAKRVQLCVLAPFSYYGPYRVEWLQTELNRALAAAPPTCEGLSLDFRFEYYRWPVETGPEVVASRRPLYGSRASGASR